MSSQQSATAALRVFGALDERQALSIFGQRIPELHKGREEELLIYRSSLPESRPLSAHIEDLLELLEVAAFKELKNTCNVHVDIFCMYSSANGQGSMELDAKILKRLAAQEIDLILDLYPPTCSHCDEED